MMRRTSLLLHSLSRSMAVSKGLSVGSMAMERRQFSGSLMYQGTLLLLLCRAAGRARA